ncbi:MAG: DUF5011 domain-containing protein [Bacilli bacterium]|nr:DUF5011 domain-containing protein [Bacilli bacterium]
MKKKLLLLTVLFTCLCTCKKVYAFDVNNYRYKSLCDSYEVAGFHSDGYIDPVACFGDFGQAQTFMKNNGAADLAIMTKVNGETKIIDANMALLDLSVNPTQLTYFYENSELTSRQYTYMDTGSLYGGVDGGLLDVAWSNAKGKWVAKVRIGNFSGWIPSEAYEIVPITWIKSYSNYVVTSDSIRHNYVTKIQNDYKSSGGNTIGPKPEMLNAGTYYSYDGHYFYTSIEKLMKDYKNNTYTNSVNKNNPYYNYYMYLSNHTKTAYSSINIDEYIRNNMGYNKDVYGHIASSNTSRLYGSGTFFYYAQQKYGVNAILSLSLSRNETGNGRSYLAINKNNGFGLNAVDSNPIGGANWYATFGSSILGYASKWVTYGFAHPRDWRYFGPQFGDKWIGMNVKYASDTYWSEKMAANYYNLDKAYGLQDYNYYQLGVLKNKAQAYAGPSTSAKWVYEYPEAEDAVVIIGEVKSGNETWYKVQSDLNIDSNSNEITSGNYNWNGFVYVRASDIKKINTGKNGYIAPTSVTDYQDSNYEYDLYIENTELKPRVGISTRNTTYYYDSSLTSSKGQTLLKDRYVIVYAVAKENNQPVSYLVTSDYFYSEKHWVKADSIKLTNTPYGKVTVDTEDNQYTWVNYNTEDKAYSKISGLYTYAIVPILESLNVNGETWYKVPVSLSSNENVYGYTLAKYSNYIWVDVSTPIVENQPPVINATNKEIREGEEFDPRKEVTAWDNEDGDITNKIEVTKNTVNTSTPGTYEVTYKVTDKNNQSTTKTIQVTVLKDQDPVIHAANKTIVVNANFDPLDGVTAIDPEDGDITDRIEISKNTVNVSKPGTYEVIYKVVDSSNHVVTKKITVKVVEENNGTEEEGEFYLESLDWDTKEKAYTISGYLTILNQNNISKRYELILKNKDSEEMICIPITSWKNNVPYNLGEVNGKDYSDSWFKGTIDFSNVPNGDYDLFMTAYSENYYTTQYVDNFANQPIDRRAEDDNHGYNFKVLNRLRSQRIELNIRDELYTTKEAPTYRNMINDYEEIKFQNNKLYLEGYSYNYGGLYSSQFTITRKLILENTKTYQQTVLDLGCKKGPYTLTSTDKLDKTYAWYEKAIDLSNLEKGTYSLQVYTKTSNAEDYGEITDMFEILNETTTINGRTYKITYNKEKMDRLELVIE